MAKQPIRITAPFDESVARSLKAGDSVLIQERSSPPATLRTN